MGDKRAKFENLDEQWAVIVELGSFKSVPIKMSLHLTLAT